MARQSMIDFKNKINLTQQFKLIVRSPNFIFKLINFSYSTRAALYSRLLKHWTKTSFVRNASNYFFYLIFSSLVLYKSTDRPCNFTCFNFN